jgi:hypothetical protein
MKQVVSVQRFANRIRKHKVIGLAEYLIPFPHVLERTEDHSVSIERNFALSRFGLPESNSLS